MGNIDLVIKIPEEDYKLIKETEKKEPSNLNYIARKIVTGTVLPKGHGRLIDAEILRKEFLLSARFNKTWNLGKSKIMGEIENAPTIIGASKENE